MIDDVRDIRDFYETYDELTRLERHPIERDVTWRYLDRYLPASGKILEIGAGPGTYTIPLGRKGFTVTAVDLTPGLIDINQQRIEEHGLEDRVRCFVADARDLSPVTDTDYDAVLIMGPLYHLINEKDRITALKEAYSRLKSGGIIFSAFISRYGIWGDIIFKLPHYIEFQKDLLSVLENGHDTDKPEFGTGFRAYYATIPEIVPLHEQLGFTTLTIAGVEPLGITAEANYDRLPEHRRKLWLDLMFRISTEPSIVGASCHVLYIGKKPQ